MKQAQEGELEIMLSFEGHEASLIAQLVKNPPSTRSSIPGLGRSLGEGNGYPL